MQTSAQIIAYYKGRALGELLKLILIIIITSFFIPFILPQSEFLFNLITLSLHALFTYKVYYWCVKSESSKTVIYMSASMVHLLISLIESMLPQLAISTNYPYFVSLVSISALIIKIQGYLSLKKTMKDYNIELSLLGPKKEQLDKLNPSKY